MLLRHVSDNRRVVFCHVYSTLLDFFKVDIQIAVSQSVVLIPSAGAHGPVHVLHMAILYRAPSQLHLARGRGRAALVGPCSDALEGDVGRRGQRSVGLYL